MMGRLKLHGFLCMALVCFSAGGQTLGADVCGTLKNGFGPFDYRGVPNPRAFVDNNSTETRRALVEGAHFTPRVEQLIGAQSSGQVGPPGPDLDYTLKAFPNNHRALIAVMRYGEKFKTPQPPALPRVVECYFDRALRFAPDDVVARMIYVTFLTRNNRKPEALQQIDMVLHAADDNPITQYNIGLLYFDLGEFELALKQAYKAKSMGLEWPELKDKLQASGHWQDPPAEAGAVSPTPAASAPAVGASAGSATPIAASTPGKP